MICFSSLWLNSARLLCFKFMDTLRANMATSLVVVAKGQFQITKFSLDYLKTHSLG
jgi:hypothetical protein